MQREVEVKWCAVVLYRMNRIGDLCIFRYSKSKPDKVHLLFRFPWTNSAAVALGPAHDLRKVVNQLIKSHTIKSFNRAGGTFGFIFLSRWRLTIKSGEMWHKKELTWWSNSPRRQMCGARFMVETDVLTLSSSLYDWRSRLIIKRPFPLFLGFVPLLSSSFVSCRSFSQSFCFHFLLDQHPPHPHTHTLSLTLSASFLSFLVVRALCFNVCSSKRTDLECLKGLYFFFHLSYCVGTCLCRCCWWGTEAAVHCGKPTEGWRCRGGTTWLPRPCSMPRLSPAALRPACTGTESSAATSHCQAVEPAAAAAAAGPATSLNTV